MVLQKRLELCQRGNAPVAQKDRARCAETVRRWPLTATLTASQLTARSQVRVLPGASKCNSKRYPSRSYHKQNSGSKRFLSDTLLSACLASVRSQPDCPANLHRVVRGSHQTHQEAEPSPKKIAQVDESDDTEKQPENAHDEAEYGQP